MLFDQGVDPTSLLRSSEGVMSMQCDFHRSRLVVNQLYFPTNALSYTNLEVKIYVV